MTNWKPAKAVPSGVAGLVPGTPAAFSVAESFKGKFNENQGTCTDLTQIHKDSENRLGGGGARGSQWEGEMGEGGQKGGKIISIQIHT